MRPPEDAGTIRRRNLIISGTILILLLALYFIIDPVTSRIMPKCPLHALTGFDCPGCGSQRMVHALLHADFRAAFEANAFLMLLLPLLPPLIWLELTRNRHLRLYRALHSNISLTIISLIIVAWTVFRNLP